MLNLARRFLASAAAAIAMQPISQATAPTIPLVSPDRRESDAEAERIAEHPMFAAGVRAEFLAAYDGPRVELTDDLLRRNHGAIRFRNATMDPCGTKQEFDRFVEERTR